MSDYSILPPIKPDKVEGTDCLEWIENDIAFACKYGNLQDYINRSSTEQIYKTTIHPNADNNTLIGIIHDYISLSRFINNKSKRIIGYVKEQYDDGGYYVQILGDDSINQAPASSFGDRNIRFYTQEYGCVAQQHYTTDQLSLEGAMDADGVVPTYPMILSQVSPIGGTSSGIALLHFNFNTEYATLDQMIDWKPPLSEYDMMNPCAMLTNYNGDYVEIHNITDDPTTSISFGKGVKNIEILWNSFFKYNPLIFLCGDLYETACNLIPSLSSYMPRHFPSRATFTLNVFEAGEVIESCNMCSVPYNLILTKDLAQAKNYINNGTLPNDAFLFPLDWTKLPTFDIEPDDTPDDDVDDSDDPDNNPGFNGDPDLPSAPSYTPSTMSRNNYYWLGIGELDAFINWFWYDVGRWNDFDDIVNTIEGLYNNLGSAILNIRYMPVSNTAYEIGGTGNSENIKVGMIEKGTQSPTLPNGVAPLIDIGHVKVPKHFKSFASYSPYSECMLYLPLYGFINIDMDMFTGHNLYVKAAYDMLTGTVQYFIYYENKFLVNTVQAKMAVDIPITLQSKNDRDSAIFSNVSSAVAGLMGGAISAGSGNPLGLVVGANALNSGVASAPMGVKGTVGESGAFYGPAKCKLITKFPVQQKPSSFDKIVGKQLNKTMKLSNSKLSGFTQCYQPRITFSKKVPLKSEIDEIYRLLEEGVIL